jgi:hypothetical protein
MLTKSESAALMNDMEFRGRVKVSALQYADSIMIEASTVAAHNTRLRWASNTFQQPDMVAGQLQSPVVMDPAVQAAGAEITDAALQASVETVVNKML